MKTPENTALFAALLGLIASLLTAIMIPFSGLLAFSALLPVFFMMIAVSLTVLIRLRLTRLADEENRDHALLAKEQVDSSLFNSDNSDDAPFTVERSRRQFEKYLIPWLAPLFGVAQLYWSWRLYQTLPWEFSDPSNLTLAASLLGVLAFVLFLTSRFMLGLSRHQDGRLLRGPGILTGLACWGALLGLVGAGAEHAGIEIADEWVARIILSGVALLGLENLINSLLALYSHQRATLNTSYESRLGALAVDPGVLTKSMTEAMDFQFGFSFSQTWFFIIIRKAIIPLLVVQALLLYAMSAVVFLAPHEVGILERFGKPVSRSETLGSGLHVKWPWPFESIQKIPAGRVHLLLIGFQPHTDGQHPAVISWTVPHYEREDVFLVASRNAGSVETGLDGQSGVPVSMVTVNVPVEYRITNAIAYRYNFADPGQAIRQMAYQTITREFARRDLDELFAGERIHIGNRMRAELQRLADEAHLGISVEFFGVQSLHPPVQVATAYQSVVGALEEKEAVILDARAYTNRVLPIAHAYAQTELLEATAYRHRRNVLAEAESRHFIERLTAYEASPRVFRNYQYLATLKEATRSARLYVLDLPEQGSQTLWLNLEEKQFSGVLDMAPLIMEGGH
ncbi:MAG TPA: protease modulator HflK [Kiritimatiellia bacterium]|nr:protease modulator HflK [Kiritimatiellia bacterium]